MLSYEGFHDVLNAILVIIVISVIIAVAWLSTNVREQPLIATAVVVFQSGVNGEGGDRSTSVGDSSQRETQNNGTQEGETASVRPTASVKENENENITASPVMEVGQKTAEFSAGFDNAEVTSVDADVCEKHSETLVSKDCDVGAEASALAGGACDKDVVQCSNQESAPLEGNHAKDPTEFSSPSDTSLLQKKQDVSQEMEVRNRRLHNFLSMGGGNPVTEVHHHDCSPQEDATEGNSQSSVNEEGIKHDSADHTGELKDGNCSQSSSTSSPVLPVSDEDRPPGSIRIRLKFLDETQRYVFAQPTEQVGTFKRQHFSIEMDANRRIRLIFNGQLLSQDTSTLAQYGLFDNCVVHCHVSQPQQMGLNNGQSRELAAQDDDAYVSGLLAPLLYCVMVVMWYVRYEYSHVFNTMSTVILLFLTALLLVSTYLLYVTQNVPESESTAQLSSRHQIETNSIL